MPTREIAALEELAKMVALQIPVEMKKIELSEAFQSGKVDVNNFYRRMEYLEKLENKNQRVRV